MKDVDVHFEVTSCDGIARPETAGTGSDRTSDESIRLELSVNGRTVSFDLATDESRAITVGSLPQADLRIDQPGVAPVHFHFERDGNRVWIVPAYGGRDIRVGAAKIRGPRVIAGKTVLEFSGVRVLAQVIAARTLLDRVSLPESETMFLTSGEATLFDPIAAPVLSRESSQSSRPRAEPPRVTTKCPRRWWVEVEKKLSGGWPRNVCLSGALFAFIVCALMRSVSKHSPNSDNAQARLCSGSNPTVETIHPSPSRSSIGQKRAPSPPLLEIVSKVPNGETMAAELQPSREPDLLEAAGHLVAGRYPDAQRAYSALATRFPESPTYAAISRILTEKLASRCAAGESNSPGSCPEIRP